MTHGMLVVHKIELLSCFRNRGKNEERVCCSSLLQVYVKPNYTLGDTVSGSCMALWLNLGFGVL